MNAEQQAWLDARVSYEAASGCWLWLGRLNKGGYGTTSRPEATSKLAHQVVWAMIRGPFPAGLVSDHLCVTPSCVNPWHIEPVTNAENMRRRWRRQGVGPPKPRTPHGPVAWRVAREAIERHYRQPISDVLHRAYLSPKCRGFDDVTRALSEVIGMPITIHMTTAWRKRFQNTWLALPYVEERSYIGAWLPDGEGWATVKWRLRGDVRAEDKDHSAYAMELSA